MCQTNTEIFKNLNLSSTTQNNTNALGQGQAIFGEHKISEVLEA